MGVGGLRKIGNGTQFSNFLGVEVTVHELGGYFILEDIILLKNIRICLGMNVVPYSSRTNFKVPHSSIIYQTTTNFLRMGRVHICKPAFFQFDTLNLWYGNKVNTCCFHFCPILGYFLRSFSF